MQTNVKEVGCSREVNGSWKSVGTVAWGYRPVLRLDPNIWVAACMVQEASLQPGREVPEVMEAEPQQRCGDFCEATLIHPVEVTLRRGSDLPGEGLRPGGDPVSLTRSGIEGLYDEVRDCVGRSLTKVD